MSLKVVYAVVAVTLSLSAGQAFAESEGNGDPFPFRADPQLTVGRAFVADTGSAAYPQLAGSTNQPSSLARLEPAAGNDAAVQTANSLPRGFGNGSVAYTQGRSLDHYLAVRLERARHVEAGVSGVRG